jgi:sRNA-binding regulator protein Hfq
MKKIFFCFISLLIALTISAQSGKLIDVVYLRNGSILRGIIIEQIPNETIKLQTADGNIFVYKTSEIEKITKEEQFENKNKSGQKIDYNITKQGFSTMYWYGTEAISKAEFLSALRTNQRAFNQYNNGKTLKNFGYVLYLPSALVVGWELGLLIGRDGNEIEFDNPLLNFSTPAIVIGGVGFAGGLAMVLVGDNKMNKSISILNDSNRDVSLNFNINPSGAVLVFNF